MSKRVTQAEWDERAAKLGLEWLVPVQEGKIPALVRCLSCGHEWDKRPDSAKQGSGCPKCSKLRRGQSQRLPQPEWDRRAKASGLKWLGEVRRGTTKVSARCMTCGHEWMVRPESVAAGGGCPECGMVRFRHSTRVDQAEWSRRAKEAGFELLEPVQSSSTKTKARCLSCGNEWLVTPGRWKDRGCPECGKQRQIEKSRIPQSEWDRRAAEVSIEWLAPVTGDKRKTAARCLDCGHQWQAWPSKPACPKCGVKRSADQKRRPQKEWDQFAADAGMEWLEPIKGDLTRTRVTRRIRCLSCGKEWEAIPANVARGIGCGNCAEYGFKDNMPAVLYLVVKPNGVAQVGITGAEARENRLVRHRKNGYQQVAIWHFELGSDARKVEREIIRRWREEDDLLPAAPEGEDGWTETVHTDSLPLREIQQRIDLLAEAAK